MWLICQKMCSVTMPLIRSSGYLRRQTSWKKPDRAGRKRSSSSFATEGNSSSARPLSRHDIDALADLLPIDSASVTMADHKTLDPLWNFTGPRLANGRRDKPLWNHWAEMGALHPFKFARATPVGNAVVQDWINWPDGTPNRTPWLVRRGIGLGSVTWVAQDLGDPALRGVRDPKGGMINESAGWPYIWDHVFGWDNATRIGSDDDEEMKKARTLYDNSSLRESTIDLGKSLFSGTTFEGKGAGLMGIAIAFFIVYWIVAGPGSFLFLASKGRKEWSWFIFGAAAIVAAGITVILVRLVLRGDPRCSAHEHRSACPRRTRARSKPDRSLYPARRNSDDRAERHRLGLGQHFDRARSTSAGCERQ